MPNNLNEEVCECLQHAENCARQAATETDLKLKEDFLALERSWLSLARSYEFTERLTDFLKRGTRGEERSKPEHHANRQNCLFGCLPMLLP